MSEPVDLSDAQVQALEAMGNLIGHDRWALIGASAIRFRLPLPRPTADLDFAIAISGETSDARLTGAGWIRDPKKRQRWTYRGANVDVVPASQEDLLAGVTYLDDGFVLSVVGIDLAFSEADRMPYGQDLTVPVARLPVIVLLKMIAWLDRPYDRGKDLEDIVFILESALPEQDDCRWDPQHPVVAAKIDYDDQSPFFVGWQLGKIAEPAHVHWAKRFLDAMRSNDTTTFAQFVRESRFRGDNVESRLRARLVAFEKGLELGATPAAGIEVAPPPTPSRAVSLPGAARNQRTAPVTWWGRSGSIEMLLHDAIDRRRIVQFEYQGRERVGEPHVLGTKNGRLQILLWQTDGRSSSGRLPDWRRFFVDELSNLQIREDTFAGARLARSRHSAFDRQIAVVHG